MPDICDLNAAVTNAILEAERSHDASEAWRTVSRCEEALALCTSVESIEGAAARFGVITAAVRAQDFPRAAHFIEQYLLEVQQLSAPPPSMINELHALAATINQLSD